MARHKITEAERDEALAALRLILPKGATCFTILRRVSRSGMSRDISLLAIVGGEPRHPNYYAAKLLGYRVVGVHGSDALKVAGAGMDMGFHLVYSLSAALHDDGYALEQRWI